MRKWLLISIFFFAVCSFVQAQKEANIWYFGQNAGLDFNQGSPIALTNSAMNQSEGCASISDSSGHLLFYTDGVIVWNKNHEQMPNGEGLLGNRSSTQSAIIVKKPQSASLYYIFTTDAAHNDLKNGFNYSIVNIDEDNGYGDVVMKNGLLFNPVAEKVTAVFHSNGEDIWIITHEWGSNRFLAYLLTESGLNSVENSVSGYPVISSVGTYHNGSIWGAIGYMKSSPDGTKIALAIHNVKHELFDFNNESGKLSNPITLSAFAIRQYGVEFSPDGSKLYLSRITLPSRIVQYDLTNMNHLINDKYSYVNIATNNDSEYSALQLGPDGRLYVAVCISEYLDVIEKPDKLGNLCEYKKEAVYLAGMLSYRGLPNILVQKSSLDFYFSNHCYLDTTTFTVSTLMPVDSVLWNFGDTASGAANFSKEINSSHVFTTSGIFLVALTVWSGGESQVVINQIVIDDKPLIYLGDDIVSCSHESILLNAGSGYDSYLWQDGSTDSVYLVDTSGIYWAVVSNECGIGSDTIEITYKDGFIINLGSDTTFCFGNQLQITPGNNFTGYLWQDGSMDSIYTVNDAGVYWVKVTDTSGCSAVDSLIVEAYPAFEFNLGNDTIICYGDYVFLNGPDGYERYLWEDGTDLPSLIASVEGYYWLEISDTNNCIARDSLLLTTNLVPDTILGPDTLFCNGGNITLQTYPEYKQYFWQDGSEDHVLVVDQPGKYWVMVFDTLGCSGSDTINLNYYSPLELKLQATGYLCEDDSVILQAISNYNTYLWQDSSTAQNYIAKDSGTYWVRVSSSCETKSDTLVIDVCSSIWVPNVFTPNNDGYNDYFYAIGKNTPKFKMEIFNRWGQTLKVLSSIDEKWDGTYRGKKAAQGTYFWVADYEQVKRDGSTEHVKLQGSVTLVR